MSNFNGADCLPVTGKDGKTVWIFKLEDLREVVPEDVYAVIEAFKEVSVEEGVDDWLRDAEKRSELIEDGYLQMCLSARDALGEIIKLWDDAPKMTKQVKDEIRRRLKYAYLDLNNNL